MTSKELVQTALRQVRISQAEAAARVGWIPQQLSSRLVRGSLNADEFLNVLDKIDVDFVMINRKTGKEIRKIATGEGRRVKRMVDGVTYDTSYSEALANNFFADGKNKYNDGRARELYIDSEGRYFFAEYSENNGTKDRINPVSASDAAEFLERYLEK